MSITAYVTPADLLDEFGERELVDLTDIDTPRSGQVVQAVAQRACDRANAEVEMSVSARYAVPLGSVPAPLKYIARDMAHFYLYQTSVPTWVKDRHDAALANLRAVRDGKLPLGPDVAGLLVPAAVSDLPEFSSGAKVWSRDAATGGAT